MRAASPLPDWTRSVGVDGDLHIGGDNDPTLARWSVALAGLQDFPECRYHVQVGDVVEPSGGAATQDANGRAALQALPGTVRHVLGNHDTKDNSGNSRTGTAAALGLNVNPSGAKDWALDTDFGARLIGVSPEASGNPIILDTAALDFITTAAGDTAAPCIVFMHAPLAGTVGHGDPTSGPNAQFTSDEDVMSIDPDVDVRARLNDSPNIVCVCTGHTHSPYYANRFVTSENVGSRQIAHINASAIYYVGRTAEPRDPIRTFFLTLTAAGAVEVRARDHRANCWLTWPDGSRAQTVTPT